MRNYAELYNKEQLERWYLEDHLTLEEIAEKLGISRQAVWNRIRRCRIDTSKAERFDIVCDGCGKPYSITRKRFLSSIKHFCSPACHMQYMRSPEYKAWRQGQRIARKVWEEETGREVRQGEVIHHIDGNNGNNAPENLMLFKDHGEHMAYHHKLRREGLNAA